MTFEVGDKVRVKKDLEVGDYGGITFVESMKEYKGKVFEITTKRINIPQIYYVLEMQESYAWSEEMFERPTINWRERLE